MPHAGTNKRHTPAARNASHDKLFAAIDLGTNNCRLLIAAPTDGPVQDDKGAAPTLKVVDSFSRIVKLGEGVSSSGKLSKEAMERTIAALKLCQKKLARYPVVASRFVATEACRRASNREDFVKLVKQETDMDLEIISSEEEAKLAFEGCASLLTQSSKRAIVFDIGGGSTELMWVDVQGAQQHNEMSQLQGISDWLSINCGVMNLADRFGGNGFAELAYKDMVKFLEDRIEPFDDANGISDTIGNSKVQMLSTSGTVTTLAAIHLDLPRYDRSRIDGIKLKISEVRGAIDKLLSMRPSERFHHSCIGPDRADYIISGCAIFEAISNVWPTGEITIADRGVREGIIISLSRKHDKKKKR